MGQWCEDVISIGKGGRMEEGKGGAGCGVGL